MFIGGLNWDTTDGRSLVLFIFRCVVLKRVCVEGLKKYFEQFGKVEACTIMRDATGRSRCFAFLTFEDPASVNAVMVREHYLDGKIASVFIVVGSYRTNSHVRRLILSVLSRGKSINVHRNCSLAGWQPP